MDNGAAKLFFRLILLAGFLLASFQARAGMPEALAAYKAGNFAGAMKELGPLAEGGLAEAQFYVGLMYDNGDGVVQDYRKAIDWYTKAADQGFALAESNLGVIYEIGGTVDRDLKKAEQLYLKAAEQGDASAQHNLAAMYYVGRGDDIPRNYEKALKWYKASADQGDAASQKDLGRMYEFGQVVDTDYAEAYKWYALSAEAGNEQAQSYLDATKLKITPDQLKQAEASIKDWKNKHKKSK